MKCPHCQEELGLNDICINPACSYFGIIINSSGKSDLNDTENNLDNKNSYTNESNSYTSNTITTTTNPKFNNTNLNSSFNNTHTNRNNYNIDNESINNTNSTSDNISKEEFAAFISSHNTNYYLDYTDKIKTNNKFLSWNWACFFLGPYWLLYRKLYAFAAILLVVNISSSLLIPGAFSFIIRIVLSMFANAIYLNHAIREISTVKTIIGDSSTTQYINTLHKKGGVNLVAPLILISVYILVIVIIFAVFLFSTGIAPHNFSSPSYSY